MSGSAGTSITFAVAGDVQVNTDQTVTVWVDGGTYTGCTDVVTYIETTFSCLVTVPGPGVYEITASSVDIFDPTPSPLSAAVMVTVNEIPTDITSFESGATLNSLTTVIEGVGPPFGNMTVSVTQDSGTGPVVYPYCAAFTVPESGNWVCTPPATTPWTWGDVVFDAVAVSIYTGTTYGENVPATLVPGPPQTTLNVGPASVAFTATGPINVDLFTEVWDVELNGEGSMFEFYDTCNSVGNPPVVSCSLTGLAPGVWHFSTTQVAAEVFTQNVAEFVRIPTAPTGLSTSVQADRSVRFSGQGVAGYRAIVRTASDATVCSAIVQGSGSWQCVADLPVGTATYRAIQQSVGFNTLDFEIDSDRSIDGFSAFTSAVSVTVPAARPVVATPTPTPVPWTLEGYDGGTLIPGQSLDLSAQGLPADTTVVVEIRSTPQVLGTAVADALGAFALTVTIPNDLEIGDHTLVAIATPPGGVASTVSIPVSVVAAPIDPVKESVDAPAADKDGSAAAGEGGPGASSVDRSNPASPSAISDQIPTIDRIFRTPLVLLGAGGLALAILLLVAFPAELLNSTLASNTRRIGRWYAAVDAGVERATEWFAAVTRTRAIAAAVLVVTTSLIFGFIDPNYGFDPVSLRMTLSLAIGLFIVTYVSAWISGAIIGRVWDIPTRISLQPAALVFAVLGVIVARLLEFSPGFLIGLVIGLDLLTRVGAPHRVRATLTNIGVIVGLAVLAWIGFSIMTAVVTGDPTVVGLLISDALVATTSEGLTAALAALLPLGYLQGHEIFRHSKRLWAASFAGVAAMFALIVLPTAGAGPGDAADIGFWILVMVVFAAVTLTLWAVLHFTGDHSDDDETADQPLEAARS